MNRILLIASLITVSALKSYAQDGIKLYNPEANAQQQIEDALALAKKDNKHVFIQVGGNWCSWCLLFHNFVDENAEVKKVFEANYVPVKLNYSKENKNPEMMVKLGFPNRFGFPVFVILDAAGNRLHTQNSAYLEEGKGYDVKKVTGFFQNWSPAALNPDTYKD